MKHEKKNDVAETVWPQRLVADISWLADNATVLK
jgi:hypothetical protein